MYSSNQIETSADPLTINQNLRNSPVPLTAMRHFLTPFSVAIDFVFYIFNVITDIESTFSGIAIENSLGTPTVRAVLPRIDFHTLTIKLVFRHISKPHMHLKARWTLWGAMKFLPKNNLPTPVITTN
jgi:hypothetical protein